jgi:hypothetical protein
MIISGKLKSHLDLFFFFLWDWGLSSGLCTGKAGTLLLEPHLKSILEMGSHELLAWADLELLSSQPPKYLGLQA